MLECRTISRRFDGFTAVDRVSFAIGQGEIVGLLGRNGAGKTTIMRMITGALEPSDGQVLIDERDMQAAPQQLHREFGYLPEHLPVYPEMTVIEYLDYCASMRGIARGEERSRALRRVIEQTQIADKLTQSIATLSRGFKQRVGVAQALLTEPRYLILDEPTNGLDPEQTRHMRELIISLREKATIILSTHIMQEVNAVCDRVLMVHQGALALDAPLAELANSHRLELTTDTPDRARQSLEALKVVDRVDVQAEQLIVDVPQAHSLNDAAAEVARALVGEGIAIHSLTPRKRDLESLFMQVSEGREVNNAA